MRREKTSAKLPHVNKYKQFELQAFIVRLITYHVFVIHVHVRARFIEWSESVSWKPSKIRILVWGSSYLCARTIQVLSKWICATLRMLRISPVPTVQLAESNTSTKCLLDLAHPTFWRMGRCRALCCSAGPSSPSSDTGIRWAPSYRSHCY